MISKNISTFKKEREKLNEIVMKYSGRNIKRFYTINTTISKTS